MKFFTFTFFLLAGSSLCFSQHQKYTMAEAVNGLRSNLAVENLSQPSWLGNTDQLAYRKGNAYFVSAAHTAKTDTLVSLHHINLTLPSSGKLASIPSITFNDDRTAFYRTDSTYWKLEKNNTGWQVKKWFSVPAGADNVTLSKNQEVVVYTLKNNLLMQQGSRIIRITADQNEDIVNGVAVHRNEFGIDRGIFISPDGNRIAFYRMDQTMVKDYPIIDWSVTPAVNHLIKYPMAGQASHEVKLGVYDIRSGKTVFLNTAGPKDQYLTAVTWSPDSRNIFVGILNRDQNDMKMNMYEAKSGNLIKTLFEETSDKYVEPQHPLVFLPGSDKDFIWQSQRTGYNHLFLYNTDKGFVRQVTKGDWLVTDVMGFNARKNEIYFASTKETPLERHLYKISYDGSGLRRLDKTAGMHVGILSPTGDFLYDSFASSDVPRNISLLNTHSLKSTTLLNAKDPLRNYDRPEIRNITLKADDGTPLYGKLMLPADFDPAKKYPVIVYLYNGPHLQLITNTFPASGNLWYEYMTQNGYLVFSMDGRGSSNRGMKFEQAVFRQLGEVEMKDQLKGVEYLKSLPYVDADRMGVHGWSFGGFMTTSLMLKYPEVFKAAVAGGPVMDWSLYEVMYTERYMDTPQTNPDGYANAALFDKVQNLKGHLMLIHGTQDDVVVWQHSVKFLKSAVDHGVQLDYFIYPGHQHNVLGKDRVHLMQKVTDYFDLYLKKSPKP